MNAEKKSNPIWKAVGDILFVVGIFALVSAVSRRASRPGQRF